MTSSGARLMALVLLTVVAACGDDGDAGPRVQAGGGDQRYEGSFTVLASAEHGPELCHEVLTSLPPQCGGPSVVGWDWDAVDGEKTMSGTTWGAWHVTGTFDGERFRLTAPPGAPQPDDEIEGGSDFSPACEQPDVVEASEGIVEWEAMTQIDGVFDSRELVAAWVSDPAGDWDGPFVGNVVVVPGAAEGALARIREHYAGPVCVIERDGPTTADLAAVRDELIDEDARSVLGDVEGTVTDERRGVVVATVWVADENAKDYAAQRWGALAELRGLLRPV